MSEEKKSRSFEDVQGEYQSLCLKAGHTQYQIFTLDKELGVINDRLRDLNLEAASIQAAKQEAEKASESKE